MAKNNLVSPTAYRSNPTVIAGDTKSRKPRICDIYALYWDKCRANGVMDFDDILFNMNILLKNCPDVLEVIASRFDHILVDEYQDTNYSQYLILKKLSQFHRNICVVGDDSQSIYAFRGAKIENILNFKKDYPECAVFRLEQNYRSTSTIVDAANSVIAKNSSRIPKTCFSAAGEGDKIEIIRAYTEQEEAMQISIKIVSRIHSDHAQYKDFAILYRTNAQSRALEEQLRRRNIPYVIYSGNSFFERAEVKDIMAYLKLAVNTNDDESFKRVVNKPARGIGDTSLLALASAALEGKMSLFRAVYREDLMLFGLKSAAIAKLRSFCDMMLAFSKAVPVMDAYELAVKIATDSGLWMFYKADTSIEGQSRTANIEELLNSVKIYVEETHSEAFEQMQLDEDFSEIRESDLPVVTLGAFLENISLLSAVDLTDEEEDFNKVSLMTVHSSKGLEFPYVFIAGMEENLFPSGGSLVSQSELEEERRLFYVALTRAMKAATLSLAATRMRNGSHESNSPSRFIGEIDKQYILNPLDAYDDDNDDDFDDDIPYFRRPSSQPFSRPSGGFQRSSGGFRHSTSAVQKPSSPAARRPSAPQSPVQRPSSPQTRTSAVQRPSAIDFTPSPIMDLREGQRVEHNRFGLGVIKNISKNGGDYKATIDFDDFGEKLLLLKYAKVRIVEK